MGRLMLRFIFCICFLISYVSYANHIDEEFLKIEKASHLKIGVYVHDTNNHRIIAFRENERFPLQSTSKMMIVAAMFKKNLEQKRVSVLEKDLIFWHPISGKYLNKKVSLKTLAEAAISYSDNPATNLIIKELGGLKKVNQFARSISNNSFRLSHYESHLNSNPKRKEDTSTPKDMGYSVEQLLLTDVLGADKDLLMTWMRNSTTGYQRIRAGVPLGWVVADKTGSGSFGIANDIGIVWSPSCKPVVLSIFTVNQAKQAIADDHIIAKVTQLIFKDLLLHDECYQIR